MFDTGNLSLINASVDASAPNIFSYETDTDTIADIMADGYFNYTGDYHLPSGYIPLMKTGDKILVKDKDGDLYELVAEKTDDDISLSSNNIIMLQTLIPVATPVGGNPVGVWDLPPKGFLFKMQVMANGTLSSGAGNGIISRGAITNYGLYYLQPGQFVYDVTLPVDYTQRVFNGNVSDTEQQLKFNGNASTSGTYSLKFNSYFIIPMQ